MRWMSAIGLFDIKHSGGADSVTRSSGARSGGGGSKGPSLQGWANKDRFGNSSVAQRNQDIFEEQVEDKTQKEWSRETGYTKEDWDRLNDAHKAAIIKDKEVWLSSSDRANNKRGREREQDEADRKAGKDAENNRRAEKNRGFTQETPNSVTRGPHNSATRGGETGFKSENKGGVDPAKGFGEDNFIDRNPEDFITPDADTATESAPATPAPSQVKGVSTKVAYATKAEFDQLKEAVDSNIGFTGFYA